MWRLGVECGERCPGFTLAAEPQTVQKGHTITIGEAPSVTPASDRLICTVAVGEKGLAMLAATGPLMQRYAAKVGADFLAITGEALNPHYPLGDKFRLHHFTTLYDRLMFIDADALVHPDAPDLFGLVPDGVAIFDDRPFVPNVDYHLRAFEETARSQGVELPARCGEWVLNSGVVLWGRGDFRLWEPPTKPLPLGMHVAEQNWTQINLLRASYEWSLLGREWNYQWWSDRPMAELGAVKPWVLHMAGMGQPEMVPGGRLEPAAVRQIALKAAAWATGR